MTYSKRVPRSALERRSGNVVSAQAKHVSSPSVQTDWYMLCSSPDRTSSKYQIQIASRLNQTNESVCFLAIELEAGWGVF